MNRFIRVCFGLTLLAAVAGCGRFIPADQKTMQDAIKAGDQAVRSEERTWAMVLRIEELTRRLEKSVKKAEDAAAQAEKAAEEARQTVLDAMEVSTAVTRAEASVKKAEAAAAQAEEALRRIEAQEGESLQKMLEFMRELGYKP